MYIFRDADGHPLYVGKSIDLRTRARAHFTTGAAWTAQAEHVDHQTTHSELGALLLEDRLIKALKPPGNTRGKQEPEAGWKVSRSYLESVVENADEYIEHPAKLDWDWLKSRVGVK